MKPFLLSFAVIFAVAAGAFPLVAQTLAPGGDKTNDQLQLLIKKVDEQNTKIDALSQQLLKLEQQLANQRPGIMIGEDKPSTSPPASAASSPSPNAAAGNAHVVAKGETLTSIAKAHKVGVQELQKFNHIENDRALQIGQTIMIPPSGTSPSGSPNE